LVSGHEQRPLLPEKRVSIPEQSPTIPEPRVGVPEQSLSIPELSLNTAGHKEGLIEQPGSQKKEEKTVPTILLRLKRLLLTSKD
jgi:hypothetical protein